jgi:hypothetical protein
VSCIAARSATIFRSSLRLLTQLRGGTLRNVGRAIMRKAMFERYPGYPLEFLIDLNAQAVAKELLAGRRLSA